MTPTGKVRPSEVKQSNTVGWWSGVQTPGAAPAAWAPTWCHARWVPAQQFLEDAPSLLFVCCTNHHRPSCTWAGVSRDWSWTPSKGTEGGVGGGRGHGMLTQAPGLREHGSLHRGVNGQRSPGQERRWAKSRVLCKISKERKDLDQKRWGRRCSRLGRNSLATFWRHLKMRPIGEMCR